MKTVAISRKQFLNVSEVARLLAATETAIRLRVFRRQIPHFKVGGRILFDQEEVLRWVERHRRTSAPYEPAALLEEDASQTDLGGRT